ncbi:MAG TPA: sensor histidine kinase [Streptosporangiaceae bacterium]|nr:sensor histidine kinase [Streptosporangiaceae bacterium]
MNDQRVLSGTLRDAIYDAALRAPAEAPRTWLWPPRRWWAWLAVVLVWGMGIGYTAGTIAIYLEVLHAEPTLGLLAGIAQGAPLFVAPRWPLIAWRIMAAGQFIGVFSLSGKHLIWPWPVTGFLGLCVTLILLAISYRRRISGAAGLITIAAMVPPSVLLTRTPFWPGVIVAGVIAVALIFGDALGGRYAAETSLAEHAELRRQDLARQAVLEERARIARELHDVVAHHMSVVALQAEAAPYKIEGLPPAALETFSVIRGAAREALAETRRVVGLLRGDSEAAERVPQPGLARLDDLIAWAERAGLSVKPAIVGMPRQLSAGVDLSAYRIVQEALSNAAKYAPGADIQVEIRYGTDRLCVTITDDGPRGRRPEASGGGHGLVGMRERVAMLGGSLTAGPREAGGFEVRAELPYDTI